MVLSPPPQRDLKEIVKALPAKPGVYVFKDVEGKVIYVGKAASLASRVRSYFGSSLSLEGKTRRLRGHVADIDYTVTSSAAEALMLEAALVKRHQPLFNVRLKDDKHYPYLKVDTAEEWPRVYITRRVEKDGGRYFGPYASAGSVRMALDLVKKLFPFRSCNKNITGKDPRPCLDYFIKRCIAPCTAYCTKEEYDEVIAQVLLFLEGRSEEVVRDLRQKMRAASSSMMYEQAARIRDQIKAIERVTEKQTMATTRRGDRDVFGLARSGSDACVFVWFQRGTKIIGSDHFMLEGALDEPDAEVLGSFLKQFYGSAAYIPKAVFIPSAIAERNLIEEWLSERRGSRASVAVPERGQLRQLVASANENAREALEAEKLKRVSDSGKAQLALEQLAAELDLAGPPHRIECYDISNIQGTSSVGSMVVFIDGRPKPAEYRRFRIKTVDGANDFASMAEVLGRRFRRRTGSKDQPERDESFAAEPDLLIIDGGRGQLNAVLDVMRDMGLQHIPVAGLAKRNEELYVQDVSDPIILPRSSEALYLVQRIRDEAHRFAITYHRNVRSKASRRSLLDDVPGLGPKRKKALLSKFGSLQRVREASTEEVAATVGFTAKLAERVKQAV
ncbi:MAG: excinuclease ABC subunit UvrC [Dehalococcoidia bacterium]|nr:excinuclease ABC subunit UvrC [Dehalococcoidia bacterium]